MTYERTYTRLLCRMKLEAMIRCDDVKKLKYDFVNTRYTNTTTNESSERVGRARIKVTLI